MFTLPGVLRKNKFQKLTIFLHLARILSQFSLILSSLLLSLIPNVSKLSESWKPNSVIASTKSCWGGGPKQMTFVLETFVLRLDIKPKLSSMHLLVIRACTLGLKNRVRSSAKADVLSALSDGLPVWSTRKRGS